MTKEGMDEIADLIGHAIMTGLWVLFRVAIAAVILKYAWQWVVSK